MDAVWKRDRCGMDAEVAVVPVIVVVAVEAIVVLVALEAFVAVVAAKRQ